jgi:cyclopropane-fatty-acyl-phospholipid synthase
MDVIRFAKFIVTKIFPDGQLTSIDMMQEHSAAAGFTLTRRQSLQQNYGRTLDL